MLAFLVFCLILLDLSLFVSNLSLIYVCVYGVGSWWCLLHQDGNTALILGARENFLEVVRLLLEHPSVGVNIQDKVSLTQPSMAAAC